MNRTATPLSSRRSGLRFFVGGKDPPQGFIKSPIAAAYSANLSHSLDP
uniref:Uncharacterized protein n=1 Tax=Klebsiella pneumoniae TaxID=573 RepID=A0A8B0SP64_KLEPN|nr:hypothetical protein [Klebsiella pneumoniae]